MKVLTLLYFFDGRMYEVILAQAENNKLEIELYYKSSRSEESWKVGKIFTVFNLWKTNDEIICPLCRVTSGRMIKNQEEDEFIAVRVQDPRVQNEGSWNSYVDFKIFLHTNSKAFTAKTSCVRRRYSEFVWLKRKLQKNAGLVPVPDLPKKSFFTFINDDFIERRRKGLQSFLDKVLSMTVCLSDSQLHLFLQTQLPVKHIEDCVQGHTPYTVTEAILTYASSNRGWVQEEGGGGQELWSAPVPYESVESPAPHLPSIQSPGATCSGPSNELIDVSDCESRLSDAELIALDLKQDSGHNELHEEEESYIKLVVEDHLSLPGSVKIEEECGSIGSEEVQILDKDAKDLQRNNCEYPASQIDGHFEDRPLRGDTSNEDVDHEKSFSEDVVDITPVNKIADKKPLGDNELIKGSEDGEFKQDSTVTQTPDMDIHEEDPRVRIHSVDLDLSAMREDNTELLETEVTKEDDVARHDACEENTPDEAKTAENHVVLENGFSDEDYSEDAAAQDEEHVGMVNKLNAKSHNSGNGILILEGIEEAVCTQTAPVTEMVSNLDANTADVNMLILQAIETDSVHCQETDSHIIITTHHPDPNSHGN